ncbi:MAG: ABC transporter permease, partial [Candidatus Limnocylindrales bacterium]
LTYQFLAFMVLPLYVALEKIDYRLIEAARDLYAGPWRRGGAIAGAIGGGLLVALLLFGLGYADLERGVGGLAVAIASGAAIGAAIGAFLISESFVRVIWPLSLPGVFAGSILVFIPAIGDYINPELLGNPKTQMVGNVIQDRFLRQNDYPTAAALSFILMAGIIVAIFVYARVLGTEELTGGRS